MLEIKIDWIEGLDRSFTQIQGKVRAAVEEAGTKLGLEGSYIPHSYIEQVQLEEMTEELKNMTMEMKDKFVLAANRGYDVPTLERSNSALAMGSIAIGSAGRGRKEARSESVTRLQDAVRKKRKDSRPNSENGWGSIGGDLDSPLAGVGLLGGIASPTPRTPSRPQSRNGRPPQPGGGGAGGTGALIGGIGRTQSISATAGGDTNSRGSGDGSGGDENGPDHRFYGGGGGGGGGGGYHHTGFASPNAYGGYGSPASVALEGRLNMLTQRVDDLAQAHMRVVERGAVGGGAESFAHQSQMLLSAKLDAIAASTVKSNPSEGRMQLLVAAMGGAAAALLTVRILDAFSGK